MSNYDHELKIMCGKSGLVCVETLVLSVIQDNLILSTELIIYSGHCREFLSCFFVRGKGSDRGLTLKGPYGNSC